MSKNYVRKRKEGNKMVANLIGISGKIGSGKDTVGKILQYLNTDFKKLSREYYGVKDTSSFEEYDKSSWNKKFKSD